MKNLLGPANIRLVTLLISRLFLKTPTVSSVLMDARKGLILYLVSAMFVIAAILLVYFEIYTILLITGLSEALAIAIVFVLLLLTAAIFREFAKKYLTKAKTIRDNSKVLTKAKSLDKKAEAIVKSFLEGLFEETS